MSESNRKVNLPAGLLEHAKNLIESFQKEGLNLGYRDVSEFVRDAVRRRIEDLSKIQKARLEYIVPRTWYAKEGDLCQQGRQIYWGKCYITGRDTVHSDAHDAPLCRHIECGRRISEKVEWLDSEDNIPGVQQ